MAELEAFTDGLGGEEGTWRDNVTKTSPFLCLHLQFFFVSDIMTAS